MKTNDDRQHLTQAQLRLAVTLFWGPCQQVLLPVWLKELAKVVNGAKNRYSIHRNLPLLTKVSVISTSYLRVCRFLFHISYVELTLVNIRTIIEMNPKALSTRIEAKHGFDIKTVSGDSVCPEEVTAYTGRK